MCGIFGYVSKNGAPFKMSLLASIAKVTESRGPHSFGFAWVDGRGRLRMFKQAGRISDYIGALSIAADARLLIGHCRYATHGSPENNLNNHPHPSDGGWLVHNGVIHNYEDLNADYCLNPVTECDSETLALLIEELDGVDGDLTDRCVGASSLCTGNLAMMGLWRKELIAVRSGNPLSVGDTKSGWYLASLGQGLPGSVWKMEDNSALRFTAKQGGGAKFEAFDMSWDDEPATVV